MTKITHKYTTTLLNKILHFSYRWMMSWKCIQSAQMQEVRSWKIVYRDSIAPNFSVVMFSLTVKYNIFLNILSLPYSSFENRTFGLGIALLYYGQY